MGSQLEGSKQSDENMFDFSGASKEKALCGDLTYKTRLMGWLACSGVGMALSIIVVFVFLTSGLDVTTFAVLYSIGQVLNIAGSCFLSTPQGQLKAMKKKHRLIPSIVYVGLIILTLIIAIATEIKVLVLFLVILQAIAYYWYTISFFPFGQKILKKMCSACFNFK